MKSLWMNITEKSEGNVIDFLTKYESFWYIGEGEGKSDGNS